VISGTWDAAKELDLLPQLSQDVRLNAPDTMGV